MRKTGVTKQFHKNFEYRYDKIIAVANSWIFQDFIDSTNSVLHFWCGGGYLLNALVCGDKYGVQLQSQVQGSRAKYIWISCSAEFRWI